MYRIYDSACTVRRLRRLCRVGEQMNKHCVKQLEFIFSQVHIYMKIKR